MKKVLVIEDNPAELAYAKTELARAGVKDVRGVTNLSDGLDVMLGYDLVLSDLFFPAGDVLTREYSERFMPLYEQFKQDKFMAEGGANSVTLRSLESTAELFGVTPSEYFEKCMVKMDTPEVVMKGARQALTGIKDSEDYEKFQKIEEGIRNGTNLPLGIIATERATELGIPSVIVTSTYHHDDAFTPIQGLISVPYRDNLIDGKKNWKGGIEDLLL